MRSSICCFALNFSVFFSLLQKEVLAQRRIPWPRSIDDKVGLKCFSDSTGPGCRTYDQVRVAIGAEQDSTMQSANVEPAILAPLLPPLDIPILVPPTTTRPVIAGPSSAARAPTAALTYKRFLASRQSHGTTPLKIMVIGDSISHGAEGDWTWRYRLWDWLYTQNNIIVQFVGPYNGTYNPNPPRPPAPPKVPGDPKAPDVFRATAGYNANSSSNFLAMPTQHDHFAYWGRAAFLIIPNVTSIVSTYQPDYVLCMAGYNDINWLGATANSTITSNLRIISSARQGKPDTKFVIGDVPHPSFLNADSVNSRINETNAMFPQALKAVNQTNSTIAYAPVSEHYSCGPGNCPAAWDNIVHPNSFGEFQIAQQFSKALTDVFGLGTTELAIPSDPPLQDTPIPSNLVAAGSPQGVTLTWDRVYGARNYDIRHRMVGSTVWDQAKTDAERYDTTWTTAGQQYEYQIRTNNINILSDWTPVVQATAAPQLARAPPNINVTGTHSGLGLSWSPANGSYSETVTLYQILWQDMDTPGAFLGYTATHGTSVSVTSGMTLGHRYSTFIVSWNANGGGLPGSARPVVAGAGAPMAPTNLIVNATDPSTVSASWCGDPSAAGYRIWLRNVSKNETSPSPLSSINSFHTNAKVGYLVAGTQNYEFCVSGINGNVESPLSNCVRGGTAADGPQGTVSNGTCYNGSVPGAFTPA